MALVEADLSSSARRRLRKKASIQKILQQNVHQQAVHGGLTLPMLRQELAALAGTLASWMTGSQHVFVDRGSSDSVEYSAAWDQSVPNTAGSTQPSYQDLVFSKAQMQEAVTQTAQQTMEACTAKMTEASDRYEVLINSLRDKLETAECEVQRLRTNALCAQQLVQDTRELQQRQDVPPLDASDPSTLNSSTSSPDATVLPSSCGTEEEREQERPAHHMEPGDYVALGGLKNHELNGEKGTVKARVKTGRFCVELGAHKLNQKVCIKPENITVIETGANITAVSKLRDEGSSVSDLISKGYSVIAIQCDSSSKLCGECYRPRYMCGCTYEHNERQSPV